MIGSHMLNWPVKFAFFVICYGQMVAPTTAEPLTLNSALGAPLTNERKTGFLDIIATEAFKRNGIQLSLITLPAARGLKSANAGIVDGELTRVVGMEKLYPNLVPVPEMMMYMDFVGFSNNSSISINGWNTLKPYSVGFMRGWKIYEKNIPKGTDVLLADDAEQLFTLLERGRVDVVLYTRLMGLEIIRRRQIVGASQLAPPLAIKEMYMYLHKRHVDLAHEIGTTLAEMKAEGIYSRELKKLEAKYSRTGINR